MLISIIISTYNVQEFVQKTVNSVINQRSQNFELIIVDDGSTDNTKKIILDLLEESSFNNYQIISKSNGGVSSARNYGLQKSKGEYILFLDGDDYLSYDLITNIETLLIEEKPDVLVWGFDTVNEDGFLIRSYQENYSLGLSKLNGLETLELILSSTNKLWIWICSTIWKKKLLFDNDLSFSLGCSNGEDQEFILKSISKSNLVIHFDKTLSFYVRRKNSISNIYSLRRFETVFALKRAAEYVYKITVNLSLYKKIRYKLLVKNYLNNFSSCIDVLVEERGMTQKYAVLFLLDEIESRYPNLNDFVIQSMKSAQNPITFTKIISYIFMINPVIYIRLLTFKRHINL